jgi:hypothetical protein
MSSAKRLKLGSMLAIPLRVVKIACTTMREYVKVKLIWLHGMLNIAMATVSEAT